MGKLFDRTNLKVPNNCSNFGLLEFDQMESSTSGGTDEDDDEEENGLEISPWIPSEEIDYFKALNRSLSLDRGMTRFVWLRFELNFSSFI